MLYAGVGVLIVVFVLVGLVVAARGSHARGERKMRDEIRAYVESKGGTVSFDDADGMTVEGTRGRGHERLTGLRIMLGSATNREQVIGFALRKYLPDAFDGILEANAAKRLETAQGAISALPAEALRERCRVKITSTRTPSTGLSTLARPVVEGYEARVVLDGFDLDGIPEGARSRLPEDDATLFAKALDKTLGVPPSFEELGCEGHVWLAAPARVFGSRLVVVGACGMKLAWISAKPESASAALATLAGRTLEDGPLKGVLLGWDGSSLSRIAVTVHSIKGPSTPDFTIELPPALRQAFELTADAHGRVAVNR